jgi:hypothetical protein
MTKSIKRVGLLGLLATILGVFGFALTAGAAVSGVSVSKTSGIQNKETIQVTFSSSTAGANITGYLCRATVTGETFDPTTMCSSDSQTDLGLAGSNVTRPFQVFTGALDNDVTCDPSNPCRILVGEGNGLTQLSPPYSFNTNGSPCPSNTNQLCISFAPGDFVPPTTQPPTTTPTTQPPTTTPTTRPPTTTPTTSPTTTQPNPTPVVPEAPYAVLLPLLSVAVFFGALVIVRNRRSAS